MSKTILITGATDGIGKLTAQMLIEQGHHVLLHGRNASKLSRTAQELGGDPTCFIADLSRPKDIEAMAQDIKARYQQLDVLINNAGVLKTSQTRADCGLDVRFMVNMIAPYMLTQQLRSIIPETGRVVNLSSAAQARVNIQAMEGHLTQGDMDAYAQSKLGITIWSMELARAWAQGPMVVAVNPGSLLASKMVKEGFGLPGKDLKIGADILCRAALSDEFAAASGQYYDNDARRFSAPNVAALDTQHVHEVMQSMHNIIEGLS